MPLTSIRGEISVPIQENELKKHPICNRSELEKQGYFTRWIEHLRDEVTVVKRNDKITAFSSICPHAGGDFHCNSRKGKLVCRWHGIQFDIDSGKCLDMKLPALKQYPVEIIDDKIWIREG